MADSMTSRDGRDMMYSKLRAGLKLVGAQTPSKSYPRGQN